MSQSRPTAAQKAALWKLCRAYVDNQRIGCPESIYQCDRVIENAYEFFAGMCEIVGYHVDPDGDEPEDDES